MKNPKDEDSASKVLQERYASILGVDVIADAAGETPMRRRPPFLLSILAAVTLGSVGVFFGLSSPPVDAPARTRAEPHPAHAASPTSDSPGNAQLGLPGAATSTSKHTTPDTLPGTSLQPDRPNVPGDSDIQAHGQKAGPGHSVETPRDPVATDAFLVVLLSTKSKDEALKRAQVLGRGGYTSTVILSSTGYYGVVIRHGTYEQAKEAMQKIYTSGLVRHKPYIMTTSRVKAYLP